MSSRKIRLDDSKRSSSENEDTGVKDKKSLKKIALGEACELMQHVLLN